VPNLINNQLLFVLSDGFYRSHFVGLKPKEEGDAAYRWLKPTAIETGIKQTNLPSALADGCGTSLWSRGL